MYRTVGDGYPRYLDLGSVVYFVDGPGTLDLAVRKATVVKTEHDGRTLVFPKVAIWEDPNDSPGARGRTTDKTREALFTGAEARWAIDTNPGDLTHPTRDLDALIVDPYARPALVAILGNVMMDRMANQDLVAQDAPQQLSILD